MFARLLQKSDSCFYLFENKMVQNRWGDWKIFEAWLTYRVSGRFCFPSVQIGLKSTGRSVNYRVLLLPLTKDHCSSTKHLSDNLLSLLLCSDSIKKIFWNFSILLKPPIMAIFMFSNKENTLTDPCLTYTKLHVHVVNEMKYASAQAVRCCVSMTKNYAVHSRHHSIHAWLLGQSSCPSHSSRELHV